MVLFALILALLSACDQACDVNVTGVAKIDNRTGVAHQLKVCARGAPNTSTLLLASNQIGQLTITSYTTKKIKTGGPSNACDPIERTSGVFLTTESFSKVKFCHSTETTADIVAVDLSLTCPGGYVEQTSPIDNCN